MKKIKYLLIIVLLIVVGCKKNSVILKEFIECATNNAYYVESNKKGYEDHNYIKNIYYAINRENAYDIQFLELENVDYAKKFILVNVDEIKSKIIDKDYVKSNAYTDYEYYHAENDTNYYLVIRSKNNIIYIDAPIEYINEIEDFLEDLDLEY